ncbi:MAG: TonB-dependent receptor [Flavobacteriales bacterium]|nr:TonB-dependent receptor [Flavobacteriales bacterium]
MIGNRFCVVLLMIGCVFTLQSKAQGTLRLSFIDDTDQSPLPNVLLLVNDSILFQSDAFGLIEEKLPAGKYRLECSLLGFNKEALELVMEANKLTQKTITLAPLIFSDIIVFGDREDLIERFNALEDLTLYAAKKTALVIPQKRSSNLALNNARQVFAEVPGLNIWESDDGGLQLGIGGRGLNPNRTSNFNTRQNGYDISADPHGYPESYYTPPLQAVEKIALIRGAAALQFGPQFGGMVDFRLRKASEKKFGVISEQSYASFNTFSTFNAIGGTLGRLTYNAFFQYKSGDGWRENSAFEAKTGFLQLSYQPHEKWIIGAEVTHMDYLSQQPGGLTDTQFQIDPSVSLRDRNWFQVNWNLMSAKIEWEPNLRTRVSVLPFALIAKREALGFLGLISRTDPGEERDLIRGTFENYGLESRMKHRFELFNLPQTVLGGVRYFKGNNRSQQALANDASGPDFFYIQNDFAQGSDYSFDNENIALFTEALIQLNEQLSITPGARYEYLLTASQGEYALIVRDGAGNILPTYPRIIQEENQLGRDFLLLGLGVSYKGKKRKELYANFSQNYRGINFSDVRIENPRQLVAENIQDERGFNLDLGWRGGNERFYIDASLFHLSYQDKIGNQLEVLEVNPVIGPETFQVRQNLGDASIFGLEFFGKLALHPFITQKKDADFSWDAFINVAWISAEYDPNSELVIAGNRLEFVPEWNIKTGSSIGYKRFSINYQFSFISEQFTDASNAGFRRDPNGVVGEIPAYWVHDLSAKIDFKKFFLEGGSNNALDARYFTRRATGYPGPGIIPSAPRMFYVNLGLHLWN